MSVSSTSSELTVNAADSYVIEAAGILAVKIMLPNVLLIKTWHNIRLIMETERRGGPCYHLKLGREKQQSYVHAALNILPADSLQYCETQDFSLSQKIYPCIITAISSNCSLSFDTFSSTHKSKSVNQPQFVCSRCNFCVASSEAGIVVVSCHVKSS